MQRPWNYQSRLRPCFNCGEQYERESVRCTTCGAKRGVVAVIGDAEPKEKEKYITLGHSHPPTFAVLEDSIRNRFVNACQISLELLKDWLSDKWWHFSRKMGAAKSSTNGLDSNVSLGDLYHLHLTQKVKSHHLSEVAAKVPDLDYISAFFYEDLVRTSQATDFRSWRTSIENTDSRLLDLVQPYMEEVYCRGKAVFIGAELRASGVWRFEKWKTCLLAQLTQRERQFITPFVRQIFKRVKDIMQENTGSSGGFQVTTGQRRAIMAGLGLVLLMLLVPPWKSSLGSRRGYGFIVAPPRGAASIDLSRLFVQILFVVLLSGGIVFILQNREK
jgi:hypothetical protein